MVSGFFSCISLEILCHFKRDPYVFMAKNISTSSANESHGKESYPRCLLVEFGVSMVNFHDTRSDSNIGHMCSTRPEIKSEQDKAT